MKNGLLLLAAAVFTISCSKSNSGGGPGALDVTPKNFKASGPAQKEIAERYSVGCSVPGEPSSSLAIDSRLRVGHIFGVSFKGFDSEGYKAAEGIQRITGVTANSVSSNIKLSSQTNLPLPSSFNQTCQKSPDEHGNVNWECDMAPLSLTRTLNAQSCSIEIGENGSDISITPGTYLGRKSYWEAMVYRGEITCDGTAMGPGTMLINIVTSNQIPATDIYFCGGTQLFLGSEMKLESGKILSSSQMSITQAPVVAE